MRLIDQLNELHDHYARMINDAVERDDLAAAHDLAQGYEDDAIVLMAEREGLTHLLPLQRQRPQEGALRGLVRRLGLRRAA
jgi:hypothetical protein